MDVPMYEYPFAHETAWRVLSARLRGRPSSLPLPSLRNIVRHEDQDGRIYVCRPQSLIRRAVPVHNAPEAEAAPGAAGPVLEASQMQYV